MEWKDKSWDKKNISKYHLAVQISTSYIRLANSDAKNNKILALAQVPFLWNNEFIADKFLLAIQSSGIPISKKYAKVSFCIENNCFTLMPESLTSNDNLSDILSINCSISANDFVQKDIFKPEQIALIYSINIQLKNWIKTHFPSSSIKHSGYYLLESFVHKISPTNTSLVAYLQSNLLYVLVTKNGKVNLLNSYFCSNSSDLLYYITAVTDALNIATDNLNLYLSGEIAKTGESVEVLKNYFTKFYFIDNALSANLPQLINGKENHFYSLICNQLLCE
jgi:hypothetical protein